MKILFLLIIMYFLFIFTLQCSCNSHINPYDGEFNCNTAYKNLTDLGCPIAKGINKSGWNNQSKDISFVEFCESEGKFGVPINVECLSKITSCEKFDECSE